MMTYLRYWAVVGFLLLGVAVSFGLPSFSSKWSHVVVGFMLFPLAWSWHYVKKQPWTLRDPALWALVAALLGFVSALLAGNPYSSLLGWVGLVVGLVIFQLVRSLTPEHRTPFLVGVLGVGVLGIGLSLLAGKTAINVPWVSAVGTHPLALAAFGLAPLVCGMLLVKRQALWKNIVLGLACALVALPLAMPSTYTQARASWQETARLTPGLMAMVRAHPFFGIGAGNVQSAYPPYATSTALFPTAVPSTTLDLLVSYGSLPLLALLGLITTSLWGFWKFRSTTRSVWLCAGAGATVALCVVGNLWQYPGLSLAFWVILGLIAQPVATQEVQDRSTRRLFRYSLLTLSGFIALQALVMGIGLNRFAQAERLALSGNTKDAASLYAQSLRFDPDPEQRRAYAESLWLNSYQTKKLDDAERQARLAYTWNRDDAYARQIAARVAFSQGQYADAERLYREALDRDPYFSLDAYLSLADVYKKQGKVADERAILQEGLGHYPPAPTASDVSNPAFLSQLQLMQARAKTLAEQR